METHLKLKDICHLYLGCPIDRIDFNTKSNNKRKSDTLTVAALRTIIEYDNHADIKLKLRKLDSMKDGERKDIWKIIFNREFPNAGQSKYFPERNLTSEPRWVLMSGCERVGIELNGDVWADSDLHKWKFSPHAITVYLLSKHFDLFNLIENGEAIDISTTKA